MGAKMRKGAVSKQAVILVAVMAVGIGAAAWYSDMIGLFFKLQAWDQKGPSRVVDQFLTAIEQRKQEDADKLLTKDTPKPLVRDGKWLGYFLTLPTGAKSEYRFTDFGSRSDLASAKTEFVFIEQGAAIVTLPNVKGQPAEYRLNRVGTDWRINQIPGGRASK